MRQLARVSLLVLALSAAAVARAATPPTLTQQGRLFDATGAPLAGSVQVTHSIYASDSDTEPLWSETRSVSPDDGYFSVRLGEVTPLPADLFAAGAARYLGIKVGPDAEMKPREALVSVPYALTSTEAIGDIHPASVTSTGDVKGAGAAFSGPLSAATITTGGAVNAASINASGAVAGASLTVTTGGASIEGQVSMTFAPGYHPVLIGDAGCGGGWAGLSVQGVMGGCTDYSMIGNGQDLLLNRPGGGFEVRNNNAPQLSIDAGGNMVLQASMGIGTGAIGYYAPSLAVAGPIRGGVANRGDCDIIVGDDICFFDNQNGTLAVKSLDGSAYAPVYASAFVQASTATAKRDIHPLSPDELAAALQTLRDLPMYTFRYKHEADGKPHTGVIAEDSPPAILSEERDAVDLYDYVGVSVAATKALATRTEQLEAENAKLKGENAKLEERLERLEKAVSALSK